MCREVEARTYSRGAVDVEKWDRGVCHSQGPAESREVTSLGAGVAFYLAYKTGAAANGSKGWETSRKRLGRLVNSLGDRIEGEDDAGEPA